NFFVGTVTADGTGVATEHGVLRPDEPITAVGPVDRARAAVRPEFVEISKALPTADANAVEGKVIGVSHLGETHQCLVELGPNLSLTSRVPTPNAPDLQIGERVWCSWRSDSVQVFAEDASAVADEFVAAPTTTPIPAS